MKANIHPVWNAETKVTCACGNVFTTGSTLPEIRVEICSNCHPLYTGQQRFVDTLGQVDRFQQSAKKAEELKKVRVQIQEKRALKVQKDKSDKPSLKDLLMAARRGTA